MLRQNLQDFLNLQDWSLLEGDFAEVGVYEGHSAKVIVDFCTNGKKLFLYDTFEGLPHHSDILDNFHRKGDMARPVTMVLDMLKDFIKKVVVIPGICPESAKGQEDHKFCLVNLDVDTYQSTLECLLFFYPLLVKNGILMIQDDYDHVNTEGVTLAMDNFLEAKNESLERFNEIAFIRKRY